MYSDARLFTADTWKYGHTASTLSLHVSDGKLSPDDWMLFYVNHGCRAIIRQRWTMQHGYKPPWTWEHDTHLGIGRAQIARLLSVNSALMTVLCNRLAAACDHPVCKQFKAMLGLYFPCVFLGEFRRLFAERPLFCSLLYFLTWDAQRQMHPHQVANLI